MLTVLLVVRLAIPINANDDPSKVLEDYDGDGVAEAMTRYLYDDSNNLIRKIEARDNGTADVITTYLYKEAPATPSAFKASSNSL